MGKIGIGSVLFGKDRIVDVEEKCALRDATRDIEQPPFFSVRLTWILPWLRYKQLDRYSSYNANSMLVQGHCCVNFGSEKGPDINVEACMFRYTSGGGRERTSVRS